MELRAHTLGERRIAEVVAESQVITTAGDALDLLGNAYYQGFDGLIVRTHHLPPDFFLLKSGLAGETLQKFSNYRMRLSVVGDLSKHEGKALQDFIRESNKGRLVNFHDTLEEALQAMST